MSSHAKAASAQFEAEIHIDSDDERTLPHDPESHSESDDRRMSQQRPLLQSSRQPQRWISQKEWTDYIQQEPNDHRIPSSVASIFKVPTFLKDTKKESYVPRRVSLGPYHHGSAELPEMGHHKGKALRRMKEKFNANKNLPVDLNDMDFANRAIEEILKLEKEIRDSYEEDIDCSGKTLARMLSLDGCFLLQVLRSLGKNGLAGDVAWERYRPLNRENNIVFAASGTVKDILVLENQVPFIVLLKLLELELSSAVRVEEMLLGVLLELNSNRLEWSIKQEPAPVSVKQLHHLLSFLHRVIVSPPIFYRRRRLDGGECSINIKLLCRQCIKCCSSQCIMKLQDRFKRARNDVQKIRPAVELRNAGIRFRPCEGGIQDIDFDESSATIFLPPIRVTDITEVLFHNLIAFEMCQPLEINYVRYYVNLMDNLIDSEEDVALLIRMGVLGNWVGRNKEVVDLFKGLRKAAPVNLSDAFDQLTKKVNDHYENQIMVQLQFPELVRDYFSSPWKALASAAAIVLLLLTLVQTTFSIISVYR
eukprot:PITA_29749